VSRDEEFTYVSKGEDYIPPDGLNEHEDSKLVKLSFGGHSVFMTHSTLQSYTPVSIIMKCHGSELVIAYERDAAAAVDGAAAQTEGFVKLFQTFIFNLTITSSFLLNNSLPKVPYDDNVMSVSFFEGHNLNQLLWAWIVLMLGRESVHFPRRYYSTHCC